MTTASTQRVNWDLQYDIHLGSTWSRFMAGLRDRVILANSCPACDRTFVPPQAYCESCFERTDAWRELPGEGSVEVFTVAWHGFRGGPQPPYAIGGIRLDGASTLLMHWIVGPQFSPDADLREALPIGTRVKAEWAPERTGQILDIAYFTPLA